MQPGIRCLPSNLLQHMFRKHKLPKKRYYQQNHIPRPHTCAAFQFRRINVHQQFSAEEHLTSTEEWLRKYPMLTDTKLRPGVYVIDHALAALMVEKLGGRNLSNEKAAWVEVNPGPGVVTRALLEAGLPQLTAIESQEVFNPELEEIKAEYPERFTYVNKNFFSRALMGDRYYELLESLPKFSPKSFNDEPPLKIICHSCGNWIKEKKFSREIQHKLLQNKDSIFSQGRVQLISLVSSLEYMNLVTNLSPKVLYRLKNVLQHHLFDTESLLKVPKEYVYPTPLMKVYKDEKYKKIKKEPFVLLSMTPKLNLFEELLPAEYLGLFQFFLKELLVKRSARLIPKIEIWFPNRGLDLIRADYSMTHTVKDISPDELLKIFKMILTWPELQSSSFYSEYYGQNSHLEETPSLISW